MDFYTLSTNLLATSELLAFEKHDLFIDLRRIFQSDRKPIFSEAVEMSREKGNRGIVMKYRCRYHGM